MKKFLVCFVLFILSVFCLSACNYSEFSKAKHDDHTLSRFVLIEEHDTFVVVYDKETKVMYTISNGSYNLGVFTLLVDSNGNPLLYND